MFATLNASTKLPHCGSRGPFEPAGHGPRRMERGREDADEGQDRERHQPDEQGPSRPELAASDLHRVGLPAQALDGEDDDQDQDHEHDGQRGCQADAAAR